MYVLVADLMAEKSTRSRKGGSGPASGAERHHGTVGRHRFRGDPARFQAVVDFISARFPDVRYVADVAGGQGMLSRLLKKQHNIESEVIDPRGWTLRGVPSRRQEYMADIADYYDLVVGLHPDEALREVVLSARRRPVLVVPCCNFWSRTEKLGRDALVSSIEAFHATSHGISERVDLPFAGPHNRGLMLMPPAGEGERGGNHPIARARRRAG